MERSSGAPISELYPMTQPAISLHSFKTGSYRKNVRKSLKLLNFVGIILWRTLFRMDFDLNSKYEFSSTFSIIELI